MKHIGPISGIAASGTALVATAGYDNQVILWDAKTRRSVSRALHDHLANQCSFSPCGRYLVSASSDYSARIWEIPSMRLRAALTDHDDDVEMAVFAPQGDRVATCSRDHRVRVFDLDGTLLRAMQGHAADVISVAWDDTGTVLITSSDDGTVRRWNAETGEALDTLDLDGVETDTIAIAADGTIFAGNDDGEILVIRGRSVTPVSAHAAGIKRLSLGAGGRLLASVSYDRSAAIWQVGDGTIRRRTTTQLPSIVWPRSCTFLDDSRLVFGTFGSAYAIYDLDNDRWQIDGIERDISLNAVTHHDGHTYAIGDAGIVLCDGEPLHDLGSLCNFLLPAGDRVLTGGQMGTVFDAVSGATVHQHRSPLNCGATFQRDGVPHAIVGAYTGEGLVFRMGADGPQLVATLQLHDNAVKGVACSADTIFSVCATGAAAFHRIDDFGEVTQVDRAHARIANGCTALPDGRFASISRDLTLRIWQRAQSTVHETPHKNSIKCIAASPDGRYLCTGDYVGWVAVFEVASGKWLQVTRPTAAGISSLAPAPGPALFTASSYDGRTYPIALA